MYRTLLTALLAGLLASACSSGPKTFSERMDAQADSYRQLGEQWENGRDMVKKGEKRVASGNKQVERGRWDIRQGENLIAEGNSEVRTYRQLYQQHSELQQEIAACRCRRGDAGTGRRRADAAVAARDRARPVSYTHLTLPTIYSV